jgi:hypothetical protein
MNVINNTWGKKCQEYPNVRILYFLGEENLNLPEFQDTPVTKYIHLAGVGNDYLSATYKQWYGMKYIYEHYQTKFIHCLGTDTYVNVPKMLHYLNSFNPESPLYLGGHGDYRQLGSKNYYYHSGGAGFTITCKVLEFLYPVLTTITEDWGKICNECGMGYLNVACDVSIAYYLQQPHSKVHTIKADAEFLTCNYIGWPCHMYNVDIPKILSCHNMNPHDSLTYTQILEDNNYFM